MLHSLPCGFPWLSAARLRDFHQFEWATNRQANATAVAICFFLHVCHSVKICWDRARGGWRLATVPLFFYSCSTAYQLFVLLFLMFQYSR